MAKSRSRKRSRTPLITGWLLAVIFLMVAYARHTHTAEFVLSGIAAGLIAGFCWGKSRARPVVTPAPRKKAVPGATAPRKPKRVVHRDVDPDAEALLAEMAGWSQDCLDGRCGECSGFNPDGAKCTHCNHPGRRRGPGKDAVLDDEEIHY